MKRLLWIMLALALKGCSPYPDFAFAQTAALPPPQAKTYTASQFGNWALYVYQGNSTTGAATFYVNGYNDSGQNIPSFIPGLPITVDAGQANADSANISSVQICNSGVNNCVASQICNPGSQLCAVTATLSHTHSYLSRVQSGTYGLQEAINVAIASGQGGTVLIDQTWGGSTGLITSAIGTTAVVVQDNRSGTPINYQWNGSAYAISGTVAGVSSITATAPIVTSAATGGVTLSCPTCGTSGVITLNTQAGAVTITGDSSVTVTTTTGNIALHATASAGGITSINSDTTPAQVISCSGSGLSCTTASGTTTIVLSSAAGTGTVNAGSQFALAGYPTTGSTTTVGPAPHLWALTSSMTNAQINTLLGSLSATQDSVIIPPGVAQQSWTNTGNVPMFDERAAAVPIPVSQGGVSCDAAQYYLSFTAGSNTVNITGFPIFAGMSIFLGNSAGYGIGATQTEWTPTITSVTGGGATAVLSSNSPLTTSQLVNVGTDNTANLQALMESAGFAHPILIPSGCNIMAHKLSWDKSQSLIGQSATGSQIWGAPGEDVLQSPDASGAGGASTPGTRLQDLNLLVDGTIDATKGVNSYNAAGTLTVIPPLYRPLLTHTEQANNPLGIGWAKNATNGVASVTGGSGVICVPTALGRMPVVGYQLVFRDLTNGVFTTSTVSLTGSGCATGFSPATVSPVIPSGDTAAQAEWVSTSSVQTSTTALGGTITYPVTITLANSIAPDPSSESNVATHGRIKAGTQEFDYLGATNVPPYQITLRRGPAACSGVTCSAGFTVAPENPCAADYETPWPVTPSINSGDSTPSGANWFPGQCGGAAAISFPQKNGNTYVGTGLSSGFLTNVAATQNPNVSPYQGANNTAGVYFAGNNSPYASRITGLKIAGTTFGYVQGPASYGQHGVAAVGPTATGNHITNCSIRAAYPLIFDDMQQSDLNQCDTYSTEISTYDGSQIGATTCLVYGYTLDEQTGGVVTNTSQDWLTNWNCEPEGGNHQETPVAAELDGYSMHYIQDTFEGGFNYSGGGAQIFEGGQLSQPWVNYGSQNDFSKAIGSIVQGYISNTWQTPHGSGFIDWGKFTTCGSYSEGGSGPISKCGIGEAQSFDGTTHESTLYGLFTHPVDNYLEGQIKPGEWNTSKALDSGAMLAANVIDTTEPRWGRYTSCNLSSNNACQPNHFGSNYLGGIWIGPHNRIVDAPYQFFLDVKTASAASTFYLTIFAFDSGSGTCASPGQLLNQQFSTTTSWAPIQGTVDFTGKASCTLSIQFGSGSTNDTLEVGYFDFIPQPQMVIAPYGTQTAGAACPAGVPNGAYLGNDANNQYVCAAGVIKASPLSGSGGVNAQTGAYTVAASDAGKLVTVTSASAAAVTLPAATTTGFTAGYVFNFKNEGAGVVTITPTTSTIDGYTTLMLEPLQGVAVWSDGTNYHTANQYPFAASPAPTCAVGTAAGTGATCSIIAGSTNGSGQVQVNMGTGTTNNSTIVTLTLANGGFKVTKFCLLSPNNSQAGGLTTAYLINAAATLTLTSGASTPAASQTYVWNWGCP